MLRLVLLNSLFAFGLIIRHVHRLNSLSAIPFKYVSYQIKHVIYGIECTATNNGNDE